MCSLTSGVVVGVGVVGSAVVIGHSQSADGQFDRIKRVWTSVGLCSDDGLLTIRKKDLVDEQTEISSRHTDVREELGGFVVEPLPIAVVRTREGDVRSAGDGIERSDWHNVLKNEIVFWVHIIDSEQILSRMLVLITVMCSTTAVHLVTYLNAVEIKPVGLIDSQQGHAVLHRSFRPLGEG